MAVPHRMDKHIHIRPAATRDKVWFFRFTLFVLIVDLSFGGATHGDALSSGVTRLVSLALLSVALWRVFRMDSPPHAGIAWLALCAVAAIPAVQLIPLSPAVWSRLPGRDGLVGDYRAAGIELPWLPISLAPAATLDALLALIPPSAMLVAAIGLRPHERRRLILAIPIFAIAAVALAMLQVAGGVDSSLRFYAETNRTEGVGFFANRNHQAALLVIALVYMPLWSTVARRERARRNLALLLIFAIELILSVGLGVTRSRAGVVMAIPAIIGSTAIVFLDRRAGPSRRSIGVLILASMLGAGLTALFGASVLIGRFNQALDADERVRVLPVLARTLQTYFPVGSGLGSFAKVYQRFEPIDLISPLFLNHAHNDFLELAVETGVLGIIVGVPLLLWLGWVALRTAVRHVRHHEDGWRTCAALAIGLLLAHSVVDYPLRTAAMACVFALSIGVLISPIESAARGRPAQPRSASS